MQIPGWAMSFQHVPHAMEHPDNGARGGFLMNCTLSTTAETLLIAPGALHELVRGQDGDFVKRFTPLVRAQSVTLDLSQVERIDAAGIAALISLYGIAREAGNDFAVANASARVLEILRLVGLDRILVSHNAVQCAHSSPRFARSAA
jgi:anti-anti-sigma factor